MWDVDNETRFAHAHSWDRDRDGAETWIVVVKATFDILPDGSTRIAEQQVPVTELPKYHGSPGTSSLRLDTDLLRTKPTTDVIVNGHAYARGGQSVEWIDVSLKCGTINKTVRVHGDRVFRRGIGGVKPGAARPFLTMPLVYERAFGGAEPMDGGAATSAWDERNPVGVGFGADSSRLIDRPAPNLELPNGTGSITPAGFGAIAPHWLARRRWAGTYDAAWQQDRKPLVPDDLDDRYFLCAPPDQQPARHLTGGEVFELRHMSPQGLLRFALPRVALGFETVFDDGAPVMHRQLMHSVIIEPDFPRVCMVWQTSLQCHAQVLKLDHTRVTEKTLVNAGQQARH